MNYFDYVAWDVFQFGYGILLVGGSQITMVYCYYYHYYYCLSLTVCRDLNVWFVDWLAVVLGL